MYGILYFQVQVI